jgi:hypothetical protein
VGNYNKKWVAKRAAHRVRGVAAVANEIEIWLSTTAEHTDTDIAAAAKQTWTTPGVTSEENRIVIIPVF